MSNKPKWSIVGSLVMDLIVGTERFPSEGESVIGRFFNTVHGRKGD